MAPYSLWLTMPSLGGPVAGVGNGYVDSAIASGDGKAGGGVIEVVTTGSDAGYVKGDLVGGETGGGAGAAAGRGGLDGGKKRHLGRNCLQVSERDRIREALVPMIRR